VPPEAVLKRLNRKKSVMENLETQKRVRDVYLKFVDNGELVRIDGERTEVCVFEALHVQVLKFLGTFRAESEVV
jgi:thymidylate kinase